MSYLVRALSAEILKTHRSLIAWSAVIAPGILLFLYFFVLLRNDHLVTDPELSSWMRMFMSIAVMWSVLALPLFITLVTTLLAHIEHSEKQWKHWFATPVPRWTIYSAKWIVAQILVWTTSLVLLAGSAGLGLSMRILRPGAGFEAPIPWIDMVLPLVILNLTAGAILSIHLWIAARFPSVVVAIGSGMAAATANLLVMRSDYVTYFPWTVPFASIGIDNPPQAQLMAIGIAGGLLLALAGCWNITQRDVL
jgi:lantibiotic transport system permease protein